MLEPVRLADSDLWLVPGGDDCGGPDRILPGFGNTMRDGLGVRAERGGVEIAIVGDPSEPATAALVCEVTGRVLPGAVLLVAPPAVGADLSPLLRDRDQVDGLPTAYVCRSYACELPVTDPAALGARLDAAVRGS